MTRDEWLKAMCHERNADLSGPVSLDGHAVATDGVQMVVLFEQGKGLPVFPKSEIGRLVYADPPRAVITTTAEELRAWVGEPQWELRCAACAGKGEVTGDCETCGGEGEIECACPHCDDTHFAPCVRCKGTGEAPDNMTVQCRVCSGRGVGARMPNPTDHDIVSIAGCTIDGRRLARMLSQLSGDCAVWQASDHFGPLYVSGHDWRLILMPVRAEDPRNKFERWRETGARGEHQWAEVPGG